MMNIILPRESHGRKLDFVVLRHPRTTQPAKFLVDKGHDPVHPLFELTRVGSDARSGLVQDQVYSDGSMVVATPLHPLFVILPVLFDQQKRALPLEILLNLSSDEKTESLHEEAFTALLPTICDGDGAGQYLLNLEKLKTWLDTRVQRLRAGLPPMVKAEVLKAIQPLNPHEQPSSVFVEAAETYAASSMLATSWLSPQVADWFLAISDFSTLEAEVKRLEVEQVAFSGAGSANSEGRAKRLNDQKQTPAAKRTKTLPQVKNNTSILDMFKQARPSKSSN